MQGSHLPGVQLPTAKPMEIDKPASTTKQRCCHDRHPSVPQKKHRIYFKKYLLRLKGTIDELRTARPRIHPPFIQQPGRMEQHWLESGLHGRLAEDEPTSRVPTGQATNGLEPTNPHQTSPP